MIDSSSLPTLDLAPAEEHVSNALGELGRIAEEASTGPATPGFNRVLGSWMLRNPAAAAHLLVVGLGNAKIEQDGR